MVNIEKLPFYGDYLILVLVNKIAEIKFFESENQEKQFERFKKFYRNVGADYTKNQWMAQEERMIARTIKREDSFPNLLKRDIRFGSVVENAVEKQDEESFRALSAYENDEEYGFLAKQILFYVGGCEDKYDPDFTDRYRRKCYYTSISILLSEGGWEYFNFYLRCMQICLKRYRNHSQYETVKSVVSERCKDIRFKLDSLANLSSNIFQSTVLLVSPYLSDLEVLMEEEEKREKKKRDIFAFVKENKDVILECIKTDEFDSIKRSADIIQNIHLNWDGKSYAFIFECEGGIIASDPAEYGFFYSADDILAFMWGSPKDSSLLKKSGDGYLWEQLPTIDKNTDFFDLLHKNYSYYTVNICGHFYYYEVVH